MKLVLCNYQFYCNFLRALTLQQPAFQPSCSQSNQLLTAKDAAAAIVEQEKDAEEGNPCVFRRYLFSTNNVIVFYSKKALSVLATSGVGNLFE